MGKLMLLTTLAACILLSDSLGPECTKVRNDKPASFRLGLGLKKSVLFRITRSDDQPWYPHMGTLEFYSREEGKEPVLLVKVTMNIDLSGETGILSLFVKHEKCGDDSQNNCLDNVSADTFPAKMTSSCKDFMFKKPEDDILEIVMEVIDDGKILKLSHGGASRHAGATVALISLPTEDCVLDKPRLEIAGLAVTHTKNLPYKCRLMLPDN